MINPNIKLVKKLLVFTLALIISVFNIEVEAQNKGSRSHRSKHRPAKRTHRKRVKRTKIVHHHYKHLPKRGAVVEIIHARAKIIKHKGGNFRFHEGIWYKPYGPKWIVVRPAFGIRIATLPVGYRKVRVGSKIHYYYYGTYYTKVEDEEEYEVIEAPLGAEIDSLPDGYDTVNVEGKEYYEMDGVYYMPSANSRGDEILVVVENPKK